MSRVGTTRLRGLFVALTVVLTAFVGAFLGACRSADPDTATLHTLGLRQADLVSVAQTISHVTGRTVEPGSVVYLEVARAGSLPTGSWSSLSKSLTRHLLDAAGDDSFHLTTDPAAEASHRLALSVAETGALNRRDLTVRNRLENGASVSLTEAECALPRH